MLTKTQFKIMQVFAGQITEPSTMRNVGRILKMNYSLVYRSIKPLIQNKILSVSKQNYVFLNYKENHDLLAYVEYMGRSEFLKKPRNANLALCLQDFIEKTKEEAFVLLVFGSAVNTNDPKDIDILLIVNDVEKTEPTELLLRNISRNYGIEAKVHIIALPYESVYEMLESREQRNVMNEVLNKHVIIYGAELFYRLLVKGRK